MKAFERLINEPLPTLWAQRRMAALGFAAGLALAVVACAALPARWEARMTVGPAGRGAGFDLSAFLPTNESPTIQYLLQRVGAITAADFSVYEMLLTSPRVAAALQRDKELKPRLAALCAGCDGDPALLARWLEGHVRVSPLGSTQMRRVSVCMADRGFALDMLRAAHRMADETVRADLRVRTDQRIAYLREQLGGVVNLDQRDALIGLLKEQERMRMMVGIDADFAAEAIDPPSLPARPSFPDPYLFLPVFALLGAAGGVAYGLWRR